MAEKIGRFEVVSQLAQSPFATVYKANDAEAQQTVALKVVSLDRVRDRSALTKTVFEEAERAKSLGSHNIAGLFGVGDEGDLLLAAAEYVQGNSIATTLARNEGFSIWDLQDIARQVCQALDHAQGHQVVHQSLEPAKIMVQWDGLVKVLGFGISSMNATVAPSENIPEVMHYFAPEQLHDEALDHRSAIFSLGAVLYEMATEQKAFAGSTAEQVRVAILETTPPLPHRLKGNVNPALSELIMKALAKDPNERFQSGQELVRELEQCKSTGGIAAKQTTGTMVKAAPAIKPPAKEAPKANAAAAASAISSSAKPLSSPTPANAYAMAAPAVEAEPAFRVDPMMAEGSTEITTPSRSFSDVSELPPLKEVRVVEAPPTPETPAVEAAPEPLPAGTFRKTEAEKAKVQVREIAQTAVREIRKTPPKLYVYAIGVAVAVIGIFLGGFRLYNYFQDRDSSSPAPSTVAQPAAPQPPNPQPAQSPTPEAQQAPPIEEPQAEEAPEDTQPSSPASQRVRKGKGRGRPAAAAVVQAQLSVNSTPEGAEISFDGSALCQTPCTLTGIAPGQHVVTARKAGFAEASRSVSLEAAANASVSLQLSQLTPIVSVSSNPAGAAIVIDGRDTGKLTPAQIILDKPGKHSITIRRYGYLESSNSLNVELGQTSTLNLDLTKLGSTEEIKAAGGKFKKVFGRGDSSGQGVVSVKTQPKGAQIMVNNRVLDKTAPFDFYLNPGTYVIDITMNGYRPLHRVVNIQEGEKLAIEENLLPE
jgi:eukaryotic-like serine/threonine-protein kinase